MIPTRAVKLALSALVIASALAATQARAATRDEEIYEENLINRALSSQGLRRESNPAGKKIERVYVSSNDVVGPGDVWPQWFNNFHVTTTTDVVERELLFKSGDRWDTLLVDESARNLRNYLFLTTARIVAAQGNQGGVVAVVVTKDLWSLRPEMTYSLVGSTLVSLEAHPAEYNLAGRNKTLGADFKLDLATYLAGIRYADPRVYGSRIALNQNADLIWNKSTGSVEGGLFHTDFGQPLYSLSTEWGWDVGFDYNKSVPRLFSGADLVTVPTSVGTPLPYEYDQRIEQPFAQVTRSFGTNFKHNLTFGWKALIANYDIPAPPAGVQPITIQEFQQNILPFTEQAGIVYVSYHAFNPNYLKLMNIEEFELTEDTHTGPDVTVGFGVANPKFGFSSTFYNPSITASYLWFFSNDILKLAGAASTRFEQDVLPGAVWVDQYASVSLLNITPPMPFWHGTRLHTDLRYTRRQNDLDHTIDTLGGDSALRGFPSQFFAGPDSWGANIELRSGPYPWHSLAFGWVAFIDMGDAFPSPADFQTFSSVGVGLRVGVPEFNKPVLRFDLATPLQNIGTTPAYFTAQFGQAF